MAFAMLGAINITSEENLYFLDKTNKQFLNLFDCNCSVFLPFDSNCNIPVQRKLDPAKL